MSCFVRVTKLFIYQFVGSTITFQESAFCLQLEEHFGGGAPDSCIFTRQLLTARAMCIAPILHKFTTFKFAVSLYKLYFLKSYKCTMMREGQVKVCMWVKFIKYGLLAPNA